MTVTRALIRGLMRMAECSGLVLAMWLIVLIAALPLALVMEDSIYSDVGSSLIDRELRSDLDLGWLEEYQHRNGGLAEALQPVRLSPAMAFENLELVLSGGWITDNRALAVAGGLFVVIWILVQGGVLTHLISPDLRFQWSTLLAAGGSYFFRFLRLALMMGVGYYGVYRLAFWLFPAIDRWTVDLTVEKTVLAFHLAAMAVVVMLMAIIHLLAEFARIVTVREKRRSMVLAIGRSARLVVGHPIQALGLLMIMYLMLGLLQLGYFWIAPGTTGSSPSALLLAFATGQAYLVLRWGLRIGRYGAEIELYDRWTANLPSAVEPAENQQNSK